MALSKWPLWELVAQVRLSPRLVPAPGARQLTAKQNAAGASEGANRDTRRLILPRSSDARASSSPAVSSALIASDMDVFTNCGRTATKNNAAYGLSTLASSDCRYTDHGGAWSGE